MTSAQKSKRFQSTVPCLAGLLVLILTFTSAPTPLSASPTLSGNPGDLFIVDPAVDCPSCSTAELDTLQQGLWFAMTRLRRESLHHGGEVCVVESSLIRDLAVLTYNELRLTGQISHNRWRDMLKAKAEISGSLSPITREMLNLQFQELVAGGLSGSASEFDDALSLYGTGSYATVFRLMAEDRWDAEDWLAELNRPVISSRLRGAKPAPANGLLNQAIIASRPQEIWMLGQLGHLLSLPDDFTTPVVSSAVDTLYQSYATTIESNFATVMRNGCGVQANAALIDHLSTLADALAAQKKEGNRFHDDTVVVIEVAQGVYVFVDLSTGQAWVVYDVTDVVAEDPGGPGGPEPPSTYDDLEPGIEDPDLGPGSTDTDPAVPDFGSDCPCGDGAEDEEPQGPEDPEDPDDLEDQGWERHGDAWFNPDTCHWRRLVMNADGEVEVVIYLAIDDLC